MNSNQVYAEEVQPVPVPPANPNPPCHPDGAPHPVLEAFQARALALDAGFSEAGLVILPYPEADRDADRFSGWIGAGCAATMRYLERVAEDGRLIRARVETPFPWARSAIVCFASYASPSEPLSIMTVEQGVSLTAAQSENVAPVSRPGAPANDLYSLGWRPAVRRVSEPSGGSADQPQLPSKELKARSAWVARYAWSSRVDSSGKRVPSDYHKILLKRLRVLESRLHADFGTFESRAYVDTGPVVERSLAVAAGLGWTGKNTCLIHPQLGSFGFLAVLLTSLEATMSASQQVSESAKGPLLGTADEPNGSGTKCQGTTLVVPIDVHKEFGALAPANAPSNVDSNFDPAEASRGLFPVAALPHPDRCGSCTRCIQACPTHALDNPYQMDANRCIAYLTIEHKGPIAEELMPGIGRQVFGCDICQDVCPWNSKSRRNGPIFADPDLTPRPELINPNLDWLASLDEPAFGRLFNGSPVRRTGFNGLRRNIAMAMGNSGLARFVPQLAAWTGAADEGLRSAARWALDRLRG